MLKSEPGRDPESDKCDQSVDHQHLIAEGVTCILLGNIVQGEAGQRSGHTDIGHPPVCRLLAGEETEEEEP